METNLYIDLPKTHFGPGEKISGRILWVLDHPPGVVRLTLGWWTEGRGSRDAAIEASHEWEAAKAAGEENFSFTLPPSPYSFSGTLITLKWALELSTRKGKETVVEPVVVSPAADLIELSHIDEGGKKSFSFLSRR